MAVKGDATLNKLILLFVFDKMEGPLTVTTLTEMCCSANDWLSYLDLQGTLDQLTMAGFAHYVDETQSRLYSITPAGRVCLADFFAMIPISIRESIAIFIKQNRTKYRRKQDYVADYHRNSDYTYTVMLKIVDAMGVQLELKFNVPTRAIAKSIHEKWPDKAELAYKTIYENLVD